MNGKIKTKFAALFAVALMITVCVVPMVGNDYGEAETVIVPSDGYEVAEVTISGTVYNADGKGIVGAKVDITGGLTDVEAVTDKNGKYNAAVKYVAGSEPSITVELDIDHWVEGTNPAEDLVEVNTMEFTVFSAEKIGGIDFRAGYISVSGAVKYENANYDGEGPIYLIKKIVIEAEEEGDEPSIEYEKVDSASISDGKYFIAVKAGLSDDLEEGESYMVGLFDTSNDEVTDVVLADEITLGTENVTADIKFEKQYVVTIGGDLTDVGEETTLSIEADGAELLDADEGVLELEVEVGEDGQFRENIILLKDGNKKVKLTISDSENYGNEMTTNQFSLTTSKVEVVTYKFDRYISGTVSLTNGDASLPIKEWEVSIAGLTDSPTAETDADGKYKLYYGDADITDGEVEITYPDEGTECAAEIKIDKTKATADIEVLDETLALISGKVTGSVSEKGIEGIEVTISFNVDEGDAPTGIELTTDDSGKYAGFVVLGSNITVSADAYAYDVDGYTFTVEGDRSGLDFVMDAKEITVTVKDSEDGNKPMKGVSVFYSLDYVAEENEEGETVVTATWSSALITGEDGTVKFKVDGSATVYVYASIEGRSFDAKAEGAVDAEEDEVSIVTDDTKYAVEFDVSPESDFDLSGLQLPVVMVGEYTEHTNAAVYVWEQFGTITLNKDKQSAYFYAPESEDGTYFLYDADGMIGDYYLDSKVFAEEEDESAIFTITLNKYVAEGLLITVKGESIAGATVSLVTEDDVVIGSGKTNSVGYFQFATTQSPDDAAVIIEDSGIYTFSEELTYDDELIIYANEAVYEGYITEYVIGNKIYNADITVTSKATENGQPYTSKVDADGSFEYIAKVTVTEGEIASVTSILSAVDADGIYTFTENKDIEAVDDDGDIQNITYAAEQTTYTVKVVDCNDESVEGAEVEIYSFSYEKGEVLVKDGLVTGKDGEVTLIMTVPDSGTIYGAKAVSTELGLKFNSEPKSFEDDYSVDIDASNEYVKLGFITGNTNAKVIDDVDFKVESFDEKEYGYVKVGEATAVGGKVTIIKGGCYKVTSPVGVPYTFGLVENDYYLTAQENLKANESIYGGAVKTANNEPLKGITVTLKNDADEVVGTGVTDEKGAYEIVAVSATKAFASDAKLDIGTFTFPEAYETATSQTFDDINANEDLFSGYYADGAVIKDVKVSYTDATGAEAFATVVDNKYYIVAAATDKLDEKTVVITATATNFYASGSLNGNLRVDAQKVPVYTIANSQNSDIVQIYAPSKVVYGTVITLAAQNEYSTGVPGEDGVIQKYKFAGWYVNGDKVSDELIYAYTVEGDCTIYADYKVSSYVAAPADESNGLSMDVLVLGIVIVVLGLLAFAYAVKFKKE